MMAAIEFWVPGVADTKGSYDTGRQGQILIPKAVKLRTEVIRLAAKKAMDAVGWRAIGGRGAVEVDHAVWLPAPVGEVGVEMATWSGAGDADKIERLLWDALTAAGIWDDDVQVVDVRARKHVAQESWMIGEYVLVRTVPPLALTMRRVRDEGLSRRAREAVTGTGATPRGL